MTTSLARPCSPLLCSALLCSALFSSVLRSARVTCLLALPHLCVTPSLRLFVSVSVSPCPSLRLSVSPSHAKHVCSSKQGERHASRRHGQLRDRALLYRASKREARGALELGHVVWDQYARAPQALLSRKGRRPVSLLLWPRRIFPRHGVCGKLCQELARELCVCSGVSEVLGAPPIVRGEDRSDGRARLLLSSSLALVCSALRWWWWDSVLAHLCCRVPWRWDAMRRECARHLWGCRL